MADNVIPLPGAAPAPRPRQPRTRAGLRPGWNPWPGVRGGRIYVAKSRTLSFYVSRCIAGRHYWSVNLHAHDPDTAIDRLKEWEKNPAGFNPGGVAPTAPVLLDEDLLQAYVRWCSEVPAGKLRRRNTDPGWIAKKKNYLAWLGGRLAGRNLRNDDSPGCLTTDDLKDLLRSAPNYRHRLATVKSLYRYLRTEARGALRIAAQHDPSAALPVEARDAAQARPGGSKVAWSKADSDKVIRWLEKHGVTRRRATGRKTFDVDEAAAYLDLTPATVRAFAERGKLAHSGGGHGVPLAFSRAQLDAYDRRRTAAADAPRRVALALRVLGGTGWHVTEVVRFSRHGVIEELPPDHVRQHGAARVLVCWHKSGFNHPSPVSESVAKAAAELVRLGGISRDPIFKWTKKAVEATGAAPFAPGRFRHRTATMQVNAGASRKAVSEGLGHASQSTTGIYTLRSVAPKLPTWY